MPNFVFYSGLMVGSIPLLSRKEYIDLSAPGEWCHVAGTAVRIDSLQHRFPLANLGKDGDHILDCIRNFGPGVSLVGRIELRELVNLDGMHGSHEADEKNAKWYLDDDHSGAYLPERDSRPWRHRGLVRWIMRAYWLTLINSIGVTIVAGTLSQPGWDGEAIVLLSMGLLLLLSLATLVLGYAFQSKRLEYRAWEQVAFFLAHFSALGLGMIALMADF